LDKILIPEAFSKIRSSGSIENIPAGPEHVPGIEEKQGK
jgi:hypothetical protein